MAVVILRDRDSLDKLARELVSSYQLVVDYGDPPYNDTRSLPGIYPHGCVRVWGKGQLGDIKIYAHATAFGPRESDRWMLTINDRLADDTNLAATLDNIQQDLS